MTIIETDTDNPSPAVSAGLLFEEHHPRKKSCYLLHAHLTNFFESDDFEAVEREIPLESLAIPTAAVVTSSLLAEIEDDANIKKQE